MAASGRPKPKRRARYDERVQVSGMLNKRMFEIFQDASASAWRKIFNWMDDDSSGKISPEEFEDMIRGELKVAPEELSDEQLLAVWHALDDDNSGLVAMDEFNNFMRVGAHVVQGGEPWIDEIALQADKRAEEEEAMIAAEIRISRSQRAFEERYFIQPPPPTNAQQAATRVYNRGGILVRSDPFVKAMDRHGKSFSRTQFHVLGQNLVSQV